MPTIAMRKSAQSASLPAPPRASWYGLGLGILFVLIFTVMVFLLYRRSVGTTTAAAAENMNGLERFYTGPNMGFYNKNDAGGVNPGGLKSTNAPQEYAKGGVLEPTDIGRSASSALSASSAVILADMSTSEAKIQRPVRTDLAESEGNTMDDIKYATKGDGQIRPVGVNGDRVSDDLVKLAMFENQDFMYRLETPIKRTPHLQDPNNLPQRSMFRKMTYPLVWAGGALGMDVMNNTNDTRVTVSFTGGRPPN